ncbi:MAG: S46 family peptidase [Gemmataceae bacterium]|nr:S46 family peptidase [Gemmataceae bacterium]
MRFFLCFILFGVVNMSAFSDEGMWLLNEPPIQRLKEKYQFDLTPEWLEHARLASIRFNNGGSGSFVSKHGLIITNHHIGSDALQKLSQPTRNLLRDGFLARQFKDELKCPDLELNVLQEIIDVTNEVNKAVPPSATPAEANAARRAAIAAIEKDSLEKTKLRSDVVTLYQGGAYHLYRYKKYTDVRLVFAPESAIAGFGGDVDNFEFPRYNLDICFFRAYENDQPAQIKHWLKFSPEGIKEGDLVFVTGHPGTTNRLETFAKLKHRRDETLPYSLSRLRTLEAAFHQYSESGPEERMQITTDLHRVANARKAFSGQYQGLLTPAILQAKADAEQELAQKLDGKNLEAYRAALEKIAAIQSEWKKIEREYYLFERGDAFSSELFTIARHLVRLSVELPKPNGERLREYRESNLDSLKLSLFSPAPIYPNVERVKLVTSLTFLCEQLGSEHPITRVILDGKSPAQLTDELIKQTELYKVEQRKKLFEGGAKAISESRDPLILLVQRLEKALLRKGPSGKEQSLRLWYEENIEEPERQAFGELSRLRFLVYGKTIAPDATFTLRLAYGTVSGYQADGKEIPWRTTFGGLYERANKQGFREPFDLPARWKQAEKNIDRDAPFNFVSTADTIGGNSGSPVLNRAGEFVGINFDRNRHGLVRNFVYTDVQARHISVHSKGILTALKLYDCPELLTELLEPK